MENFEYLFWKSQNDYLKRNRKSTFAIRESKKKKNLLFPFPIPLYFKHTCFPAAFPFSCVYPNIFSGFLFPLLQNKKKKMK